MSDELDRNISGNIKKIKEPTDFVSNKKSVYWPGINKAKKKKNRQGLSDIPKISKDSTKGNSRDPFRSWQTVRTDLFHFDRETY